MMKWAMRLVGLVGLAWGSVSTLYTLGIVLLAPLAVRTDSADFRNALIWLSGTLLFMASLLFLVVVNLLLQRTRLQNGAVVCGLIGIAILAIGISMTGLLLNGALLFYVVPVVSWCIIAAYLIVAQRDEKLI